MLPTILALIALASPTSTPSFLTPVQTAAPTTVPFPTDTGGANNWVWVVIIMGTSLSIMCCCCTLCVKARKQSQPEKQPNIQEPLLQEWGESVKLKAAPPPPPGFVLAPVPISKKNRASSDQQTNESPNQ